MHGHSAHVHICLILRLSDFFSFWGKNCAPLFVTELRHCLHSTVEPDKLVALKQRREIWLNYKNMPS